MANTYLGIFKNSQDAGEAVAELKQAGYTENISVVAKEGGELSSHQVEDNVADGVSGGAVAGGVVGALAAMLVGNAVIPGLGVLVAGPLASIIAGTAAGAAEGALIGALIDWGIPDEVARDYEHRIREGEVLVAVTVNEEYDDVQQVFSAHNADAVRLIEG